MSTATRPTVPVVLVGCGMIGHEHVRAIAAAEGFELAAICDPRPASRAAAIESAALDPDGIAQFDDWPDAIAHADTTAVVVVALPPYLHYPPVEAALSRGMHVLCEKPLARDVEEGRALHELARKHDRILHECSSRYLGPVTDEFNRAIHSREVGDLFAVEFIARKARARAGIDDGLSPKWRLEKRFTGGGSLWGHGAYDLTMMLRFLPLADQVVVSSAFSVQLETSFEPPSGVSYDVDTTSGAALTFRYSDRAPIAVRWERTSCVHGESETYVRLRGTKATLTWDWIKDPLTMEVATDRGGSVERTRRPVPARTEFPNSQPFELFAAAVRDRQSGVVNPTTAVTSQEAVFHLLVMDAVYRSAVDGETHTVDLPSELSPIPVRSQSPRS
ncbi:Gfo/Idh/MocA family protein [Nocardia beijingensis]